MCFSPRPATFEQLQPVHQGSALHAGMTVPAFRQQNALCRNLLQCSSVCDTSLHLTMCLCLTHMLTKQQALQEVLTQSREAIKAHHSSLLCFQVDPCPNLQRSTLFKTSSHWVSGRRRHQGSASQAGAHPQLHSSILFTRSSQRVGDRNIRSKPAAAASGCSWRKASWWAASVGLSLSMRTSCRQHGEVLLHYQVLLE